VIQSSKMNLRILKRRLFSKNYEKNVLICKEIRGCKSLMVSRIFWCLFKIAYKYQTIRIQIIAARRNAIFKDWQSCKSSDEEKNNYCLARLSLPQRQQ
jgi:hypothetical protein